jgi:hypothetical protein
MLNSNGVTHTFTAILVSLAFCFAVFVGMEKYLRVNILMLLMSMSCVSSENLLFENQVDGNGSASTVSV